MMFYKRYYNPYEAVGFAKILVTSIVDTFQESCQ